MHENIQVIPHDFAYKKGERKALDEDILQRIFELSEEQRPFLFQEIKTQLTRLSTIKDTYSAPAETQLSMVLGAFGSIDRQIAAQYQTHSPSLWVYRRNVTAAMVFVMKRHFPEVELPESVPEDTMEQIHALETLEERSELIHKKISHPRIVRALGQFPHIGELLHSYHKHNDIKPLLDTYRVTYTKESRPNDSIKAFLFGQRRRGSTRPHEGVDGIESWARKLLFARWCYESANAWGRDASGRISETAAYMIGHPISRGHDLYANYYAARRFFEKVLEMEYLLYKEENIPELYDFFPVKKGRNDTGIFEDIDASGAYALHAQYNLDPFSLREILKRLIDAESYPEIGSQFPQSEFYSRDTINSWLMFGTLVVERCLTTRQSPITNPYHLVPTNRTDKLRAIKQQLINIY